MSSPTFMLNTAEVSASLVEGEAVIINLSSGVYYSAAGSAALAFGLLQQGRPQPEVAAAVAERFGVGDQQAADELGPFVAQLLDESIVVPADGASQAGDQPVEVPDTPYTAPALEKYADMSDLLSLDPPMPGIEDIPWEKPEA